MQPTAQRPGGTASSGRRRGGRPRASGAMCSGQGLVRGVAFKAATFLWGEEWASVPVASWGGSSEPACLCPRPPRQGHEQEEVSWRVKGLALRLTCTPYVCC